MDHARHRHAAPALLACLLGCLVWPAARAAATWPGQSVSPPCSRTADGSQSPTDVATLGQAYACLLAHYPGGDTLDDRPLLHGAMVGLVDRLVRQGWDQPNAVLPALHGDHGADWQAFRRTYLAIAARLPHDPRSQEPLAQAAIAGMVAALHDDHTRYAAPRTDTSTVAPVGPGDFGFGVRLSVDAAQPERTQPPAFLVEVTPLSPAARAGLRPGDVVAAINGRPLFAGDGADQAALSQLDTPGALRLTIRRPGTGQPRTVSLTPAAYPSPQPVTAQALPGGVAYVRLAGFVDNAANFVFAAVDGLGPAAHRRGLVLDLRGNGGGSAVEPARLLGGFVHGAIFAYDEDGHGQRTAERTDATMPLLGGPLVALIDGGCASACDVTAAAIRDLHLGRLVGQRTAGDAAGPAVPWFLADGGVLQIPVAFLRGAGGEIVDGIGVPPDQEAPPTPAGLAAGHDAALAQALQDLGETSSAGRTLSLSHRQQIARARQQTPAASRTSTVTSRMDAVSAMPTLKTTIRNGPNRVTVCSTDSATERSSPTSQL